MTTPRHRRGHGPRLPRLLRAGPRFKVSIMKLINIIFDQPNPKLDSFYDIIFTINLI